jgi:autotransporter family porin
LIANKSPSSLKIKTLLQRAIADCSTGTQDYTMNRVYKLVWNASSSTRMAVSEFAKGKGNDASKKAVVSTATAIMILGSTNALSLDDDTFWSKSNDNWEIPENWTDGTPDNSRNAFIDNLGTAIVGADVHAESAELTIGLSTVGNDLQINSGGTVTVKGNGIGYIGRGSNSSGTVTVDGSGSSLETTGSLRVGGIGTGILSINNGGSVNAVQGLFVGEKETGQGTIHILSGGTLATSFEAVIGGDSGSVGSVSVSGSDSSWTHTGGCCIIVGNSGTGTLTINSGGNVAVVDDLSTVFLGSAPGGNGTLNIGAAFGETATAAGTLNAAFVFFGEGAGSLVFNHTDTAYDFAPVISGAGAVRLLNGTTSFNAGNLSGHTGTLTVEGGTLSIDANDTLTLGGNYAQTANGTVRIGVTNNTTYGKLQVTGNIELNGELMANDGGAIGLTDGTLEEVIRYGGTRTGEFSAVVGVNNLFRWDALYLDDDKRIDLTVEAAGGGYLAAATEVQATPAYGAGAALDFIAENDPTNPVVLSFANIPQDGIADAITQTLPLLTGGSQVAASSALTGMNRVIQSRIEGNRGLSSGDVFHDDRKLWVKPFGSWADQDDRKGVSGYKADTSGIAFGLDGVISDATRLGGSFAYAKASVNGNSSVAPHDAKVDVHQLIGYGSHALDQGTELNFQVGIGQNRNQGNRYMPAFNQTARSSYSSMVATAGFGVGRVFEQSESIRFTPSIRADYTWVKDQGYTETGAGALNLNVASRTSDELILMTDGKLTHQLLSGSTVTANLGLGYNPLSKRSSITAAYVGAPTVSFTTQGLDPSPWLVRGGLGIVHNTQSGMEILARYDAEYRKDFLNQTASMKLRWSF